MLWREILALVIAYLLGSIPAAYIVTRVTRHKDIRQVGGGNIGSLNTIKFVGRLPGAVVAFVDVGKGALAVVIAFFVLGVPALFVMLAAIFSVVGHMWMIFLKFSGGRGMAPMVGSVVTVFCVYAEWFGLGIFAGITLLPMVITRNIPLSLTIGLVGLPFIAWFTTYSATATIMAVVLGLLTGGKFLPTGLKDLRAWRARRKLNSAGKPDKERKN